MTDTPLSPQDEADVLAAEYVLGVLDLPERLAAQAQIKADPAFAARVAAWEVHFAALDEDYAEVPAPMHLFDAVEARLHPAPAPQRRSWLAWLGGAVVAAVMVLAVVVMMPAPQARVLAELASQDGGLVYQAAWDDGELQVTRVAGNRPDPAQDHELWVIVPGAAPVSLGILGDTGLRVPYPRPSAGWTLAVSVEPSGGSPTGAPTGPVILATEIAA